LGDVVFWVVLGGFLLWGAVAGLAYLGRVVGFGVFPYAFGLGAITFARVVVVVIVSTLIWLPVGVKIGMSPRLARLAQPVFQILASFPSNLLFPFLVVAFIALHLSLDVGSIVLMAVGAQWYILFNAIAGAIAIPNDLREMATNFALPRSERWRKLILPAIFPSYVTGGITAAGGAWNASIVAEVVAWGPHHLSAEGLGAYITNAANSAAPDHFAKVLAGVIVMSLFVVFVNRILWRRLYRLAESHFSL
jgi:NitT/TauT family transport system permease protein